MPRRQNASPISSRRMLRFNDFCNIYGPSRSTTYNWIRTGKLPDIKVKGSRFIPVDIAERLFQPKEES
jgi:predicted DNA-binding transcriptional regulator AlpA